jgi:hypothetical protein
MYLCIAANNCFILFVCLLRHTKEQRWLDTGAQGQLRRQIGGPFFITQRLKAGLSATGSLVRTSIMWEGRVNLAVSISPKICYHRSFDKNDEETS